jgi:single-strand DNA-binding protein
VALPLVSTEFFVGTDPDLQFIPNSGLGVTKFRVKAAAQVRQDDGSYKDGKTLWATAIVYSRHNMPMAENAYESFKKGDSVVLSGKIYTRTFTQNGEQKFVVEIEVESIGPSLRFRSTPHGGTSKDSTKASAASQDAGGTNTQPSGNQGSEDATAPQGDDNDPPF